MMRIQRIQLKFPVSVGARSHLILSFGRDRSQTELRFQYWKHRESKGCAVSITRPSVEGQTSTRRESHMGTLPTGVELFGPDRICRFSAALHTKLLSPQRRARSDVVRSIILREFSCAWSPALDLVSCVQQSYFVDGAPMRR